MYVVHFPSIFTRKVTFVTSCFGTITKTCLYNFEPLKPHFYIVKLGLQGYTLFFLFIEAVLTSTNNLCFEQKYENARLFFI